MLAKNEIIVTHLIDAPRAFVFRAWTEPERLMRWWAPKGFTTPHCTVDLRVGGVFHYCMRSPEGRDFWGRGVYREVAEPERIAYTDAFSDESGKLVEPAHYGMSADFPIETPVTVTLSREQGKTRVSLRHAVPASAPERDACEQGWTEMLDKLAEDLPIAMTGSPNTRMELAENEATFIRLLDAPRAAVFRAWTDVKQLAQWWGPKGFTNPVCEADARPGGAWRIVMRAPDGTEYPLKGIYREVAAPERLVTTMDLSEHPEEWHDLVNPDRPKGAPRPALDVLCATSFEEQDGKTSLTIRMRFESEALRDAFLRIGMAAGWSLSLDRLEALLAKG